MTVIRFHPLDGEKKPLGGSASPGYYEIYPARRYVTSDGTVYEVSFRVTLTGAVVTADVPPTPVGNGIVVRERFPGGSVFPRVFQVPADLPAGQTSIAYEDLVEVEARSLAPAATPEAAWWLALQNLQLPSTPGGSTLETTPVTQEFLRSADKTAARTAIGAGTSSLALGSTASTAASGAALATLSSSVTQLGTNKADASAVATALTGKADTSVVTAVSNDVATRATKAATQAIVLQANNTYAPPPGYGGYAYIGPKDPSTVGLTLTAADTWISPNS